MTAEIRKVSTPEAKRLVQDLLVSTTDQQTMDYCLLMSTFIWAGHIDGELACLWGVIPPSLMSNQAYLWLYTTDVIKEHQFVLVRHSQRVIEELLKEYPSLCGHVVLGSDKSFRWLKWLGAKFGPPQGTGVPFRITRQHQLGG